MLAVGYWNREVLRAVAHHKLLRKPSTCYRTVPWHQCMDIWAVEESETEFLVSYLLENPPRSGEAWTANKSACLKYVVDEVMRDVGSSPEDRTTRRLYLRGLVRFLIQHNDYIVPSRELKHHNTFVPVGFASMIYPELLSPGRSDDPSYIGNDFGDQVAIAKFLLGTSQELPAMSLAYPDLTIKPSSWVPNMTALEAALRMRRIDIVQDFFARHDNPRNWNLNWGRRLVHVAAEVGDLDMIKVVMAALVNTESAADVRRSLSREAEIMEGALVIAMRSQALDVFWYLYGIRGETATHDRGILRHSGVREACYQGNMEILRFLLHEGRSVPEGHEWNDLDCCVTPLEIAARAGRLDMVQLLLSYGANPIGKGDRKRVPHEKVWRYIARPRCWGPAHKHEHRRICRTAGAMFGAAVNGHRDVADVLLAAGLHLSRVEWEKAALGAIELRQTEFVRWMLDRGVFPGWCGSSRYDPLAYACVWGNKATVELLASRGCPLSRGTPFFAEGLEHDSLVQVAMNWSRQDILESLLALGLALDDPSKSRFRKDWEEGFFPRIPKVKGLRRTPGMAGVYRDAASKEEELSNNR